MTDQATLYLVDDDSQFQAQVARLAHQLGISFRHFLTAEQLLSLPLSSGPHTIVTDFRLLGQSGLQLQRRLAQQGVFAPMIFAIRRPDTQWTVQAMQQGAITVMDKPVDEEAFQQAVTKALEMSQRSRRLDAPHLDSSYCVSELTLKEQDVLNLILQGATNKSIAKQLGVSLRTVEVRRQHIFRKTKTRSVAELVRRVLERRTPV